jgi:hypothetical protein
VDQFVCAVHAGLALEFLALCYWVIDIRAIEAGPWPFEVFGVNALALFVGTGLMVKLMAIWRVQGWVFRNLFLTWAEPINASLFYAIAFILLWLVVLMWLLYRKRIYIKCCRQDLQDFQDLRICLKPGPRSTRPASALVRWPLSTLIFPFTSTYSIPIGYWFGDSKVALSITFAGSKIVMSANIPSLINRDRASRHARRARRHLVNRDFER